MSPAFEQFQKHQIVRSFSQAANTYEDYAKVQWQVGEHLLDFLPVTAEFVLDLGCGTGKLAIEGQSRFDWSQLSGFDIAEGMIEKAKLAASTRPIEWRVQDAEVPFAAQDFDLIFSNFALQWCDLDVVLANAYAALKPGGEFWFTDLLDGTFIEVARLFRKLDQHKHVNQFRTYQTILDLIEQNGFEMILHQQQYAQEKFDAFKTLAKSLKAIGATNKVSGRSTTLHGKGYLERINRAFEDLKNGQGEFPLSYEIGLFGVRKPNTL